MKVVVWNMRFGSSLENWSLFGPDGAYRDADVCLLNEAKPPLAGLGLNVMTAGETIGRDHPTYGGSKLRAWSTAVASPHQLQRPKDVWVLPPSETDPAKDRRSKLMASRRGAWTVAVVALPGGERITAISLYGLLDERSDASVHRSLSDLTPLLDDPRYNELLLLGGDLNPLWSAPRESHLLERVQGVYDRITKGFGLEDLLLTTLDEKDPSRGRLESCTCSLGDACRHVWTFRRHKSSLKGCQDDYLFASTALAERLDECRAIEFTNESPSDHAPIVATFDEP
jgi:hypothetical protein